MRDELLMIDRSLCDVCGMCVSHCLSAALNLVGREVSLDEAIEMLLQDKIFYETSGGGITVSGGEPFLQHDFTVELLKRCKEEGLHTAVETNLSLPWDRMESALPYVDLWMCDLKGPEYKDVISNLRLLAGSGAELVVRTPVVSGVNDSLDKIAALCEIVRSLGPRVRYEIMPFHTLGFGKYVDLGMANLMLGACDYNKSEFAKLRDILKEYGYGYEDSLR